MEKNAKLLWLVAGFLGIILGTVWLINQPTQEDWAREKINELKQNSVSSTSTIIIKLKPGEEVKRNLIGDSKPDISIKRTTYGVEIIPILNGNEPFISSRGFNGKHLWQEKGDLTYPFISYYGVKKDGKPFISVGEISPNTPLSYVRFVQGTSDTFRLQIGGLNMQLPKNVESFEFEYTIRSPVHFPDLGQPVELGK